MMAISSFQRLNSKLVTQSSCSKSSNLSYNTLEKLSCGANVYMTKNTEYDTKGRENIISPYLMADRFHLLSQKKLIHKKTDLMSSIPMAVNIYKANSDHMRSFKQKKKKAMKSVLTLPNKQAPLPQTCTVSDVNDSEFFNDNDQKTKSKLIKRRTVKSGCADKNKLLKKCDVVSKNNLVHFMDFNNQPIETIKEIHKNQRKISNNYHKKEKITSPSNNFKANDVWSVIRCVNKFNSSQNPSTSQDSFTSYKRKRNKNQRRIKQRDTKYFETCETEEFAYISSFVDEDFFQNSYSQSSIGKVTVISKEDDIDKIKDSFREICEAPKLIGIENIKPNNAIKSEKRRSKNGSKNMVADKDMDKVICTKEAKTVPKDYLYIKKNEDDGMNRVTNKGVDKSLHKAKKRSLYVYPHNSNKFHEIKSISINQTEPSHSKFSIMDTTDVKKSGSEEYQNVIGITKVILSNSQKVLSKQSVGETDKNNSIMTLKNNKKMPKLARTEINRRIACLRFPLVILGKDQVSSIIKVETYNPPQFEGLDKHIWPFMKDWYQKGIFKNGSKENNILTKEINNLKTKKGQNYKHIDSLIKETKMDITAITKKKENNISEMKPLNLEKNNIYQFMHKKSFYKLEPKIDNDKKSKIMSTVVGDICEESNFSVRRQSNTLLKRVESEKSSYKKSYPWAKRKWASNFIDNVIKKIQDGVYFYPDFVQTHNIIAESEETVNSVYCNSEEQTNSSIIQCIDLSTLPGFGDTLSDVKIDSARNCNEIAIKHCVTNTIIKFDITYKREKDLKLDTSLSCIPLNLTDSTRIFKCKTSILNAILPAELCAVMPYVMQSIIECDYNIILTSSTNESNTKANLIPISENQIDLPSSTTMCLRNSLKETPKRQNIKWTRTNMNVLKIPDLLKYININPFTVGMVNFPIDPPFIDDTSQVEHEPKVNKRKNSSCRALVPYSISNKRIYPAFKRIDACSLAESLLNYIFFQLTKSSPIINIFRIVLNVNTNSITVDMGMINYSVRNTVCKVSKEPPRIHSIYQGFKIRIKNNENTANNSISKLNNSTARPDTICKEKRILKNHQHYDCKKRKSFIRRYKKCKSTSNISNELSSTDLNKITNLDDFFLAVGSTKALSNALDTNLGKKIMLCMKEMKSWVTNITPRQALLVLLLANKKDTSNLIKYRLIILQGIAMNRITRSMELDMEIEVVEREHLNFLRKVQNDGISYLPVSVESSDTLFEELCWIAKTTASDYQKNFDESSEKHLKSLLEKRKKLNPSYLRVMARYVGLGLLKAPK